MGNTSTPFKDTAFGQLLTQKLPEVAAQVGEVLPSTGVLGIVKNLITAAPEDQISATDKLALMQEADKFEETLAQSDSDNIKSYNDVEKAQVQSEDKYTSRARPTRQYFWLLFLLICFPVSYFATGHFVAIPDTLLWIIGGDFGTYTIARTQEKINKTKADAGIVDPPSKSILQKLIN